MISRRTLAAAGSYFVIVFSLAFLLGILRTLFVAPRVGEVIAVLIEAPLILFVSWRAAGFVLGRLSPPPPVPERLALGVTAFTLLIAVELTLSAVLFGRPLSQQLAAFGTPAGLIGLAAQVAFGLVPVFRAR